MVIVLAACGEGAGSPPEPAPGSGGAGMSMGGQEAGASPQAGAMQGGSATAGDGSNEGARGGDTSAAGAPEPAAGASGAGAAGLEYPTRSELGSVLARVNHQFAAKWPDPSAPLPGNRSSNLWTRGVYYEGLLALYGVSKTQEYLDYALAWAEVNHWALRSSVTNADNQCAGQSYVELYELDGAKDDSQIQAVLASLDAMLQSQAVDAWTWVDAIQMSMPLFARVGALKDDARYFEKMHALYLHTRDDEGGGLYDTASHLWWRDASWKPDQALTPSGKNVFWSRGNGWAFAALARVLEALPDDAAHRATYVTDFSDMARALVPLQREDGFWNPSLVDPQHFGGPELTGTALFTFGLAWGIRRGLLDEASYTPIVLKAWHGMVTLAVHDDGFLGYVQSTGNDPSDGQPITFDSVPDFEDFGVGCFLLAGSALTQLAPG